MLVKKVSVSTVFVQLAVRDGWLVCAEKTGNLNHIQESAMNVLYQVMNRRIVRTWS